MRPAPYRFTMELVCWASSDYQAFEITEQIIPYFNSPQQVRIEPLPRCPVSTTEIFLDNIEIEQFIESNADVVKIKIPNLGANARVHKSGPEKGAAFTLKDMLKEAQEKATGRSVRDTNENNNELLPIQKDFEEKINGLKDVFNKNGTSLKESQLLSINISDQIKLMEQLKQKR